MIAAGLVLGSGAAGTGSRSPQRVLQSPDAAMTREESVFRHSRCIVYALPLASVGIMTPGVEKGAGCKGEAAGTRDATVSQVVAGGVVEQPASVLEKLLENVVDTGSSIDVDVGQGGTDPVRVLGDGCDIDADDLPPAFAGHALSKSRDAAGIASVAGCHPGRPPGTSATARRGMTPRCPPLPNRDSLSGG